MRSWLIRFFTWKRLTLELPPGVSKKMDVMRAELNLDNNVQLASCAFSTLEFMLQVTDETQNGTFYIEAPDGTRKQVVLTFRQSKW